MCLKRLDLNEWQAWHAILELYDPETWVLKSVVGPDRFRNHRIHMFLGFLDPDPDPDPLVRGMDPDPAPDTSIIKQK